MTLADCDVETKRGSGKGGQNRNKRDTAVRIVHRDSGAVGESQEQRSQWQNKKTAFDRMVATPKFKVYLNKRILMENKDPEAEVRRAMQPQNIKAEGWNGSDWEIIG